jgi:hypothetical protein
MPSVSAERINKTFFAFGCLKEPIPSNLMDNIKNLEHEFQTKHIDGYGYFFYTKPHYVDLAETAEMVWIKLGFAHDGEKLQTMQDIIQRGWASTQGVTVDAIKGSTTLLGLRKNEPISYIYCNLVTPPLIYYWSEGENFIATDNLQLMINLLPNPQFNDDVLAQHFIYRFVYGSESYIQGVNKLLPGEMLTLNGGDLQVNLVRDLRPFTSPSNQKPVSPESTEWFFNQLKHELSLHLREKLTNSATALSGGIDSSLIQAAINADPAVDFPFPTYSFAIDTPSFNHEIEYAKEASEAFNTNHTFVYISPQQFSDLLIESINVLGRPVSFDGIAYLYGLLKYLSAHAKSIKYLFDGVCAGGLFGSSSSIRIIQGDKYRSWPIPLLDLLGYILKPISPTKSFGARSAAQTLRDQKNLNSPECYLNKSGMGTDWEIVSKCFPSQVLVDALAVNRNIEERYLNSKVLVEQFNVQSLLTGSMENTVMVRQLGLYEGKEFVFPYGDEILVKAAFTFTPLDRYTYRNLFKPVLRLGLESKVSLSVFDQQKGESSLMSQNVFSWMRDGVLRDMVRSIERPPFMSASDFKHKITEPDWFTWNMLSMDLFLKNVLGNK